MIAVNGTNYMGNNGITVTESSETLPASIDIAAPSVIGRTYSNAFQIKNFSYKLFTQYNNLSDTFNLNEGEGDPISKSGTIIMDVIASEPVWVASAFTDDIVRRTYYRSIGDRSYELSNHLGNSEEEGSGKSGWNENGDGPEGDGTYTFYPYYWANPDNWRKLSQMDHNDKTYGDFLRAGSARIVVSVRPGFEKVVHYFLATGGNILSEAEAPDITDKTWLPIFKEIQEQQGYDPSNPELLDCWEVKLPTNLVMIDIPNYPLPDNGDSEECLKLKEEDSI